MVRIVILAIALLLFVGDTLRAQTEQAPIVDPGLQPYGLPPDGYPVGANGYPGPVYAPPVPGYSDPIGEPPWCESPYRNSAWRVELDLIATNSHVSDLAFGDWEESATPAFRVSLGYEDERNVGIRFQYWAFEEDTKTPAGGVDLEASTFYTDMYKRFFIEDAEMTIGAGPAFGRLQFENGGERTELRGAGISFFGELFYSLRHFQNGTDLGTTARGRVAMLSGWVHESGFPGANHVDHDVMTVAEIGWGIELRHRFGRLQDKYWYLSIVPEFQTWDSKSLANIMEPSFEGTSFNAGIAW